MGRACQPVDIAPIDTILPNSRAFHKVPIITRHIQELKSLNICLEVKKLRCQKRSYLTGLGIIILGMLKTLVSPGFTEALQHTFYPFQI
jgi:hypothetical protein